MVGEQATNSVGGTVERWGAVLGYRARQFENACLQSVFGHEPAVGVSDHLEAAGYRKARVGQTRQRATLAAHAFEGVVRRI